MHNIFHVFGITFACKFHVLRQKNLRLSLEKEFLDDDPSEVLEETFMTEDKNVEDTGTKDTDTKETDTNDKKVIDIDTKDADTNETDTLPPSFFSTMAKM